MPDTATSLVIVNPVSGRGRTRKAMGDIEAELGRLGVNAEWRVSQSPDDPGRWADEAAADGRRIIAFGGDGLVGAVLDAAAGRVPVAIVPGGVGNDFARALGIPLDAKKACSLLVDGVVRDVDCGKVTADDGTERRYFCIAHAGFDSETNAVANRINWTSGTILYVIATLVTLVNWRGARFKIDVDGTSHDIGAWLVAVGNANYYGGGMKVCPRASVSDGLLDVTVVEDISRLEFLRTFPRVFKGTHLDHPRVLFMRGKRIRIEADRPFRCFADGEDTAPLPVSLEAVEDAAKVVVPA